MVGGNSYSHSSCGSDQFTGFLDRLWAGILRGREPCAPAGDVDGGSSNTEFDSDSAASTTSRSSQKIVWGGLEA